jgi:hypothetical protein
MSRISESGKHTSSIGPRNEPDYSGRNMPTITDTITHRHLTGGAGVSYNDRKTVPTSTVTPAGRDARPLPIINSPITGPNRSLPQASVAGTRSSRDIPQLPRVPSSTPLTFPHAGDSSHPAEMVRLLKQTVLGIQALSPGKSYGPTPSRGMVHHGNR